MRFEVQPNTAGNQFAVYAKAEKPNADGKFEQSRMGAFATRPPADELAAILSYADQLYQLAKRNAYGVPRPRV
jgi:hypothetical protein